MNAEQLLFRLGETAVGYLEYPDAPKRRLQLEEAIEAYDEWRFQRDVGALALDSMVEDNVLPWRGTRR